MKAIVLESAENPVVYKEVYKPTLQPGEVLVQVKAAALNRRDYWITIGKYAGIKYPTILLVLPDDGTFAEYVKTRVEYLHHKPAHLDWEHAAALPLAGLTAFRALFTKGRAKKGDKVLIVGVGSGTGTFALQYAVAAGCEVFVTSGTGEKIEQARQLGANAGVSYKALDWAEELQHLAGGFDVIIDSALGEGFTKIPDLCNPGARIVTFGATAGDISALNGRKFYWKQLQLLGTTMGSPQDFTAMLTFVDEHKIEPVIDEVFAKLVLRM